MRSIVLLLAALSLPASAAAQQQQPAPPHAWLFGAWTGGLFPPPVTLSAQECLAQPAVIFTRDVVMRAVITDPEYQQRLVETVRATGNGAEFRLVRSPTQQSSASAFGLRQLGTDDAGFGCADPDGLIVQRRSTNEIVFPNCPDFPYPLVRCPAG